MSEKIERIGVIGVGHLGQHHARIYTELLDANLVGVADSDFDRAKFIGDHLGVPAYNSLEELIRRKKPDAISVVVPTSQHYEIAKTALNAGIHVLVEKPVTIKPEEAGELLEIADKNNLVLQVGHIERFNSAIRYISGISCNPVYLDSRRTAPFSPRINDVGVVLDLMIHDIDIVMSLVNSKISRIAATGACVFTDHEDIADAQITFENGVVAHILVSRCAEKKCRQLEIVERERQITINYELQTVQISRCVNNSDGQVEIRETPVFPKSEPLKLELADFVRCVKEKRPPVVGGKDGKKALEVAVEVLRQIHDADNQDNKIENIRRAL
ncbi:MAG: Gfo/Idh/MocA family oxidoreductase [Synergistaceae bacterium]|nr:Gfo/Idh/MocA family oxidoreductase [Synergistaceae bacterium]MBR0254075.1 Gfo/Idh/MocA family oxidoreductase [Synergistaceae bacterium]